MEFLSVGIVSVGFFSCGYSCRYLDKPTGQKVKPDMAVSGGLSYVSFSPIRGFIMFTCHVKTAQGTKTDVT